MRKKLVGSLLLMIAALGCLASCGSAAGNAGGSEMEAELTLAAAASLQNVFEDELIPLFHESYPGVKIVGIYASSGDLQTQIEGGLEADVFFSAATKQMNALDEKGYVDNDTRVDLLENKIVLIVPAGSSVEYTAFEDIAKAATVALGDPESVPAGQYAEEILTNLGLWEDVSRKASFGTKVTEVLAWVAEESADAGVVYATDAAAQPGVKTIAEAPAGSCKTPVVYPLAVLASAPNPNEAKVFVEFLQSDEAKKIFEAYGFTINE